MTVIAIGNDAWEFMEETFSHTTIFRRKIWSQIFRQPSELSSSWSMLLSDTNLGSEPTQFRPLNRGRTGVKHD